MSLRSFFKFPQTWLAISVLVVCLSLYFHLKGFESWSDIPLRDIRFIIEFIIIVLVIPVFAYAFSLYYYTCAAITVKPESFRPIWLAILVLVVYLLLYFDLKGFESWPDIQYRDIRFITEFIIIVLVIPALAYAFGLYYFTCAVITVKPECFQDKDETMSIHADGKVYSIKKKFSQLKIYFSLKGKHSVYLYDKKGNLYGQQEANTYEHHITYVEFKKKDNKNDE